MQIKYSTNLNGSFLAVECATIEELDAVLNHYGLAFVDVQEEDDDEEDEAPAPQFKVVAGTDVEVTVEAAQQAVKDYAAKHGIEKGRELLNTFGLKRTSEITTEQAAEIAKACNE